MNKVIITDVSQRELVQQEKAIGLSRVSLNFQTLPLRDGLNIATR